MQQFLLQRGALNQWYAGRRMQTVNDSMHNGGKERRLVGKAVIESAFRDFCPTRDLLNAGCAVPVFKEQRHRDIEDVLAQ